MEGFTNEWHLGGLAPASIETGLIQTTSEKQAYKLDCRAMHEWLVPVGGLEIDVVQSITDGYWRLKRAAKMETALLAMHPQPERKHLQRLNRYRSDIVRQMQSHMQMLRDFRRRGVQKAPAPAASSNAQSPGRSLGPQLMPQRSRVN